MGDVTEEEGEAVEVREATTQRRRRRRQRALEAAQVEQQEEFNHRLSDKVLEKCNDEELELVFTGGRGRTFMQIISWARVRAVMAPHPATRICWNTGHLVRKHYKQQVHQHDQWGSVPQA